MCAQEHDPCRFLLQHVRQNDNQADNDPDMATKTYTAKIVDSASQGPHVESMLQQPTAANLEQTLSFADVPEHGRLEHARVNGLASPAVNVADKHFPGSKKGAAEVQVTTVATLRRTNRDPGSVRHL